MHAAILLLSLSLGISAATAQPELSFATGVNATGWAQAQTNADGAILIESPEYPRGLWLHFFDEAGDALAGLHVEYHGQPSNFVSLYCVDPSGSVQETLIWTRAEGDPLRLTLKPKEASDQLPVGIAAIDWQIDPSVEYLLTPVEEKRRIGWEAVTAFLQARWQGQTGRVVVQTEATILAVELDEPQVLTTLMDYLQQSADNGFGKGTFLIMIKLPAGRLGLRGSALLSIYLFFADPNLEAVVRQALGKPRGRSITRQEAASLTDISAYHRSIHSLSGIEHLTNLSSLYLRSNQIVDLTPLANLTNLQWLNLGWNQIVDLTPLANLTNLSELYLGFNQITDPTPLANLANLTDLSLFFNQITDPTPLANLTNLNWLHLSHNQITDPTPLANLTNLNSLGLHSNQIVDLTPLANLTNLSRLYLHSNQITDLTPLANLTNLSKLYLHSNQITDLTPLANLTNLSYLYLEDNQIEDLSPLIANPSLSEGDDVRLENNPLNTQALNQHIPALQARGVRVSY